MTPPKTSVSPSTTQLRNLSGASTTPPPPRPTLRRNCGTSPPTQRVMPSASNPTPLLSFPATATSQLHTRPVSHLSSAVKMVPLVSSPKMKLVHSKNSSLSSTVKIASRPKRVSTSTKSKRTTTTPVTHTQVCTLTPSPSSQ